jgi:LemA protein
MLWLVVLGPLVLVVLVAVSLYNKLVALKVQAESAWSDIDTQLKRRHDLIPNLVETVKGYAAHEKGVFEKVTEARSRAMAAQTPAQVSQAEGMLTQALRGLYAVAENYPELKANQNFMALQQSLTQTEDAISGSRRGYNSAVQELNTKIETVPSNIIASMFNFKPREFFEVTNEAERAVPQVRF